MPQFQLSTAAQNDRLEAIRAKIGANPVVRWFDGAMPASCGAASVGTVLAAMSPGATPFAAPSGGTMAIQGTWQDLSCDAGGFARYMRIFDSTGTTCHFQALCAQAWAASTPFAVGQQVHRNGLVYRCTVAGTSASSGGPSGTGASIGDGGVTWAYVGELGVQLVNTSIAAGQTFSLTSLTITDGNA